MNIESKEIKFVSVDKIKPHPRNANSHSEEQIERLEKIIKYSGFRQPLVVSNLSGLLISGHGRLAAAVKLGMDKVPVIFEDFKDEAMEFQHLTADNAIALWVELDFEKISVDTQALGLEASDFDMDLLGIPEFKFELPKPEDENESPCEGSARTCPNCGEALP